MKKITAGIIDILILYCFSVVLFIILKQLNLIIHYFQLILGVSFIYQFIFAFNANITIGKYLFRMTKVSTNELPIKRSNDFLCFILEWSIFFVLPYLCQILFIHGGHDIYLLNIIIQYLFINGISLLLTKKLLLDFFFKTDYIHVKGHKFYFGRNLAALIIDLSLLIPIAIIVRYLLWFYIDFVVLLTLVYVLYNIIAYSIFNTSFGKYFMNITIESKKNSLIHFLFRETILKLSVFLLLPSIFLYLIGFDNISFLYLYSAIIFIFIGFPLSIAFNSFIHTTWWNKVSKTEKVYHISSSKGKLNKLSILIALWIVLFFGVRTLYNRTQNSEKWLLGFKHPVEFFKYPDNSSLDKYTIFLKQPHLSPKEYVLSLFDKYDIVIIGEAAHSEILEWDLITDIVKDPRFIEKAGNVFTEYGSANNQSKVNTFLKIIYPNDSLLNKATATLGYMRASYFNFLKNINLKNANLNDSNKINVWFTDDDYENSYIRTAMLFNYDESNRDSIMADVVIQWYNKASNNTKHKCLVVTNYRHAFGAVSDTNPYKHNSHYEHIISGNEAQYIFKSFPNITANVMLNMAGYNSYFYLPFQNGKWERAFELNDNKTCGFDFKDSPFGDDAFDYFPTLGYQVKLKYQDIYKGFIYFAPISEYKRIDDYPYQRYAAEKEYLANPKAYNKEIAYKTISQFTDKCDMNYVSYFENYICMVMYYIPLSLLIIIISFVIISFRLIKCRKV